MKIWQQELHEVLLTESVEEFKKFYAKWTERGFYQLKLPPDEVLEVSLRKMIFSDKKIPIERRLVAAAWLEDRGFSTLI